MIEPRRKGWRPESICESCSGAGRRLWSDRECSRGRPVHRRALSAINRDAIIKTCAGTGHGSAPSAAHAQGCSSKTAALRPVWATRLDPVIENKSKASANKVPPWVKAPAASLTAWFNIWDQHSLRREMIREGCLLTSIQAPWHVCTCTHFIQAPWHMCAHTHTHYTQIKINKNV